MKISPLAQPAFDARAEWTGTLPQLPEMPLTMTTAITLCAFRLSERNQTLFVAGLDD